MDERLTVGSLFSGIGGFDLGFGRAGMRTLWFCEQDPFCQRVLAKHWPGVPCHPDVRALVADSGRWGVQCDGGSRELAGSTRGAEGEGDQRQRDGHAVGDGGAAADMPVPVPYVDVLCGGFPCQDISFAGRGAGLAGERSGLWREFARLIGELRPRYVVVENVPALTSRGLDVVLADLAACGFDAEWDHLPASAFGAPHRRDRVWLVAYANGEGQSGVAGDAQQGRGIMVPRGGVAHPERPGLEGHRVVAGRAQEPEPRDGRALEYADSERCLRSGQIEVAAGRHQPAGSGRDGRGSAGSERPPLANADSTPRDGAWSAGEALPRSSEIERPGRRGSSDGTRDAAYPDGEPSGRSAIARPERGQWELEPDVGRVAYGVPQRVDRLRALGNALVPQIAEWIGRRIVKYGNLNDGQEAA